MTKVKFQTFKALIRSYHNFTVSGSKKHALLEQTMRGCHTQNESVSFGFLEKTRMDKQIYEMQLISITYSNMKSVVYFTNKIHSNTCQSVHYERIGNNTHAVYFSVIYRDIITCSPIVLSLCNS